MASDVDELETALAAAWSDDTLAVYGDHLQARGDPRGDLIAIDRYLASAPATPELVARRRELLVAWLGFDPSAWPETRFSHGFVEAHGIEVPRVLLYDLARYLRAVSIDAYFGYDVERLIERLVSRPRPFLVRLSIEGRSHEAPPLIGTALATALIEAAPNLERLELHSPGLLPVFPHPRVRELALDVPWAIASLHERGPALPAVERVELAYDVWDDQVDAVPALVLPAASFPALRRLDLRMCATRPALELLRATEVLPQLEELVLPTIADDAAVTAFAEVLAPARALRELCAHGPRHPRLARLHRSARLSVRPWPSLPDLEWHERVVVLIGGRDPTAYTAPLAPAIEYLERRYDTFAPADQDAWAALWDAITDLPAPVQPGDDTTPPPEPPRAVPAPVLGRALAAGADRINDAWAALATAVAESRLPMVAMRRGAG